MDARAPESFLPEILNIVAQGIIAQAASHGIPHVPGTLAGKAMLMSLDHIRAMSSENLRNLSLNGEVGQTIRASFDKAFGELPPGKKNALLTGQEFREQAQPAAGDQIINGRLILGADRYNGRWLAIAGHDSGPNSSRDFAGIDPRVWQPTSGMEGLTTTNFGGTEFAKAGLSLYETQTLAKSFGFDKDQIIHAGQDAKALGLNPKDIDTAKDFATLDKADPKDRKERNDAYGHYSKWMKEHKEEIDKEQAGADNPVATDEQRRTYAESLKTLLKQGQKDSGMATVEQHLRGKPEAEAAHQRIKHRIENLNGVHANEYDISPRGAREKTDENLAAGKPDSHSTQGRIKADLAAAKAPARVDADSILGEVSPKLEPKPADRKPTKVTASANGMGARV